jgi:hypothetical protein
MNIFRRRGLKDKQNINISQFSLPQLYSDITNDCSYDVLKSQKKTQY